ncbi:MAG TPA: hypothetical protein VK108_06555, partial [Pseudogracilibacillus sp.]|nr:hypothetical protein [Pseudogracilibacillus sp.]
IETCDGDPVETVEEINDDIDNVTLNIIGFDVDNAADQLLKDIADAGDGEYNAAQNETELGDAIEDQWHQKIDDTKLATWSAHQTIDIQNRGSALFTEFDDNYRNPVNTALSREESRFINAKIRLNDEELIESAQSSEVSDILDERTANIKDHVRDVTSDKREQINEEYEGMKDILEKIKKEFGE